ncbi:hypothetical protein GCM10022267_31260 [Lentzea roselyniae]|uniref:[acyl-carrier-protein] S-malonyltransferase n=1 Tax=Lentzea roselyniae TaxID=531940 RepID=A0ABP7AWP6_9PSEU
MPDRTVFLFPGLGAYAPGMLRQARQDLSLITETFEEIDSVSGVPATELLFTGPERSVTELSGEALQLAIFGASVAVHRLLVAAGWQPELVVGHSFGEIAALVCADAFSLADGVRIVCARTAALRNTEGEGQMVALGVRESVARHLIGVLDRHDVVVACVNAPRQTVVSGPAAAIDQIAHEAKALDIFCTRLQVPYASHHPSMRSAAEEFVRLMAPIPQRPLRLPVHSPVHGCRYTDADDLKLAIADCLTAPVRFADTIRDLHAFGFTRFVECGALHTLTRCVELTVPGVEVSAPLHDPAQETARLRAVSGGTTASSTEPAPRETPPARDETLARLRAMYAAALEYPPEVFTEDAQLEAELGIDSLKQSSLLTKVAAEFGVPAQPGGLRVWEFPTLGRIADYVGNAR